MSNDIKITISGAPGVGKSAIAQLVCNALVAAQLPVSIEGRSTVREPTALATTLKSIRASGTAIRIAEQRPINQAPRTGIEGIDA